MCVKSSSPLRESGLRNSGSNTIVPLSPCTSPLCLGTPNFVLKPVLMWAMGFIVRIVCSTLIMWVFYKFVFTSIDNASFDACPLPKEDVSFVNDYAKLILFEIKPKYIHVKYRDIIMLRGVL